MSTLGVDHLLTKIRDTIAADATLQAWVTSNFAGKTPTVYLGIDENDPPTSLAYPAIAIVRVQQSRAEDDNKSGFRIRIGVGLEKTGSTTVVGKNGQQVTIYTTISWLGFSLAEAFREQAENALYRGLQAALTLGSDDGDVIIRTDGEGGDESHYPLFASYFNLTVEVVRQPRSTLP